MLWAKAFDLSTCRFTCAIRVALTCIYYGCSFAFVKGLCCSLDESLRVPSSYVLSSECCDEENVASMNSSPFFSIGTSSNLCIPKIVSARIYELLRCGLDL